MLLTHTAACGTIEAHTTPYRRHHGERAMGRTITEEAFGQLFDTFEHTAFRLQTRDLYLVREEQSAFESWLAGEPCYDTASDGWVKMLQGSTASGKHVTRVRVASEPLSDWIRWTLSVSCPRHGTAGEDLRYLSRPKANELELPYEDYWLFDSRQAVVFHFDDDGVINRHELVDTPEIIVRHNLWRDAGWHHAAPWKEYAGAQRLRSRQ
jgi:hypothetical protein